MKKKYLLFLPLAAVALAGCNFFKWFDITKSSSMISPTSYNLSLPQPQAEDGDGYKTYKEFNYNLNNISDINGHHYLKSVGDSKLLVVPVELNGSLRTWDYSSRKDIEYCFFGQSSDTGWESVSSYYRKSSYGKLNLTGQVATTFKSNYTYAQLNANSDPDQLIANEFNDCELYKSLRQQYDTDSDGIIDSVVFIYKEAININSEKNDMRWWAFVYAINAEKNLENPAVHQYMWASYDFLLPHSASNPYGGLYMRDAHTYIHETGHLFGLDDYYSYENSNHYDPSGGQEMHSQNIGDENIFSKLLLGWIQPMVINTTNTVNIQLRTSSAYGDAIIINDSWNESPLDEYLILEYYSPTILNEKDAENPYAAGAQMFTTSGFRIYHIDARLVACSKSTGKFEKRVNNLKDEDLSKYYYVIGASNTPGRSHLKVTFEKENYKLLQMMQAGGVNTFKTGSKANNSDLFTKGSSFVAGSQFFVNGNRFNNENNVGYRIDVTASEPTIGSVKITKI